ncbi:GNAT family N-acetyltransferase [Virgibacillus oceani]
MKIHPLILLALCINSIAMAMYAYRNFANQETGNGVIFSVLFLFLVGLVIWGIIRNREIKKKAGFNGSDTMVRIRDVQPKDLDQILKIEQDSFIEAEAATKEVFINRMNLIPDTFLVAEIEGDIVGFINGPVIQQPYITDDLFKRITKNLDKGGVQSILGVVISKNERNRGIATMLIEKLTELAKEKRRDAITLTCREELVPFYEKHGFVNHGRSESEHAGVQWYNMFKNLLE